ncbi:MAG: transporter substrate-binding domain-containing protein, partial [Cyclobacteriaceae bacterium]|nr:transporter substrate-binding domain-containing protein [Cyclobacteriaceae bacterium]
MKNVLTTIFFALYICFYTYAETITIAHQKNYPPYASIGITGEPQGAIIDWWKLWATKTGMEIIFVSGTSDECVKMVLNDDADIVAGTFIQEDSVNLKYSEFIMRVSTSLFLKKGNKPQSVHAIKDSIGVLKDELSHKVITAMFPDLKLKIFDSIEDFKQEISNKSIAAFVYETPNPFASEIVIPSPDGYFNFHTIKSDRLRPAVKHGNEDIIQVILKGSALISDEELIVIAKNNGLYKSDDNNSWLIMV